MPTMIEAELRKPEWQAGTPITLADGQVWHFPVPVITGLVPVRSGPGALTRLIIGYAWGPPFEAVLDAYVAAGQDS